MRYNRVIKGDKRRGFVIEQAILFMFIVFTLTFLILNGVLLISSQVKIDNKSLLQRVNVEQVGEDFLDFVTTNGSLDGFDKVYQDYEYHTVDANHYCLMVWKKSDQNKKLLLYVELSKDLQPSIIKWSYGIPN